MQLFFDGDKLKEFRTRMGWTQAELGELIGKKTEHISNYENRYANPPADVLLSLMKRFKLSVADLSSKEKPVKRRKVKTTV